MSLLWPSIIAQHKPAIKRSDLFGKDGKTHSLRLGNYAIEYQGRPAILAVVCNPDPTAGTAKNPLTPGIATKSAVVSGLIETTADYPSIIGQSIQIRDVCSQVGLVAKTDATVLVQGETGTGKELVAQAVHFHSDRVQGPLIKVNCAALTETLLESELFGHRKVAFTGAVQDRKGRFKLADGGTVILDEIGCMSLSGQAKLLRVLQEREFEPIGDSRSIKVDVRVIAITNADLIGEVEKGRFREDLFYRLNVFPIRLPPLRERNEDIPLLSWHFLKGYTVSLKKQVEDIDFDAISKLMCYSWPGNIRELENTVEYGVFWKKEGLLEFPACRIR